MNKKQIELEHDKLLDISNVESYTNPNVNNEKLLFSDFVNRLQSPKITDKKGSAGGFVGGWIENTRENKNVQTRSMITIDIDDGMDTTKVWGNVEDYTNFSCVMYSTHNSQLSEPRYRLIIPLKHPIKPELYKPVSRYIVDIMQLGVDPSSHTLSQLMNYPTCEDISQYEFYYRDCPLFDAGEVSEDTLKKYSEKTNDNEPVEDIPQTDDDERLLMKIRNTKVKVDARDFPVLFDKGDISNYESASHADYALAKILAKHTGNIDQIERLMRDSALYRDKWNEHKKYLREFTINEALQDVKGGYGIKSSPEDDFQLYVKNSPDVDLKESLKNRRFEELARLESEWELNNKQGRKPTTISPIRCSVILQKYVDFILFDIEENTRVAMYQTKEGIYTRNTTIIKRVISWLEPKLNSNKADEVIYHLTNRADIKEPTISRYLIPVQNG